MGDTVTVTREATWKLGLSESARTVLESMRLHANARNGVEDSRGRVGEAALLVADLHPDELDETLASLRRIEGRDG